MSPHRRRRRTELFLLRIWVDHSGKLSNLSRDEQEVLSGRLQSVVTGEARDFGDWQALHDALVNMLALQQEDKGEK